MAADCKQKVRTDVYSRDTAEFCLKAQALVAKVAPHSAAHVNLLGQLGLACSYNNLLGADRARGYYEEMLEVSEATYGQGSVEIIEPLVNLAALDSVAGAWESERRRLLVALTASKTHAGPKSERTGRILSSIAQNYRAEHAKSPATYKLDDAIVYQKELAEHTEAVQGLKDYHTGLDWLELGKMMQIKGDKLEARRLTAKALQIFVDTKSEFLIEGARKQLKSL